MKPELYALHHDLEDIHWWFVARRMILLPIVRDIMRESSEDLIVDIGCGTGGTVAALSRHYRCLGIDSSSRAIEIARSKYPGCDFRLDETLSDIESIARETALITAMDVLEHIDDDKGFLANIARQARTGSYLLLTVPATPKLWSEHDVTAGHFRRYDERSFRALWTGQPLRPRLVSYFNSRLYPLIWTARTVGRKLGLFQGTDGSDFAMPSGILNALLTRVFAGEGERLHRLLHDGEARPYRSGVSLLALLQRT